TVAAPPRTIPSTSAARRARWYSVCRSSTVRTKPPSANNKRPWKRPSVGDLLPAPDPDQCIIVVRFLHPPPQRFGAAIARPVPWPSLYQPLPDGEEGGGRENRR